MAKQKFVANFLLLLLILCLASNSSLAQEDSGPSSKNDPPTPQVVVPFPSPFELDRRQVRLVSEHVTESGGYQTMEELVDLDRGRAALVAHSAKGARPTRRVLYQSAVDELAFEYWDYACKARLASQLPGVEWLDQADPVCPLKIELDLDGQQRRQAQLYLPGALGLWQLASQMPKQFEDARIIYSGLQGAYKRAATWTVLYVNRQSKPAEFSFSFTEDNLQRNATSEGAKQQQQQQQSDEETKTPSARQLETIQVKVDRKVVKTINILSIDYSIGAQDARAYLEVPLGYGCLWGLSDRTGVPKELAERVGRMRDANQQLARLPAIERSRWLSFLRSPSELSLEITATKFDGPQQEPKADTISVQLAHAQAAGRPASSMLLRGAGQSWRLVTSQLTQVAYEMDLLGDTCRMKHLDRGPIGVQASERDDAQLDERLAWLKFSNGLELNLNKYLALLEDNRGYLFVKSLEPSSSEAGFQPFERHFYETTLNASLAAQLFQRGQEAATSASWSGRTVRALRVYEREPNERFDLQSLTIWALEAESTLHSAYQVSLIEQRPLEPAWPEQVRSLDVANECYLDNQLEPKLAGRDFGWLEFQYSIDERQLVELRRLSELELKQKFFATAPRLVGSDPIRLARIELALDQEDLLSIRALFLDSPPPQVAFNRAPGRSLGFAARFKELAPDEAHCGHLCALHQCTVFTYCRANRLCLISSSALENYQQQVEEMQREPKCDSWLVPDEGFQWAWTLQHLIARLQGANFESQQNRLVPQKPEELSVAPEESGLSRKELDKLLEDYASELRRFLSENTTQMLELMLELESGPIFPSKFQLELDPLNQFDLIGEQQVSEEEEASSVAAAFHQGAPMMRLKLAYEPKSEPGERVQTRLLAGLTHDQCALACKDARCGLFSYCPTRHECTLSSALSVGQANRLQLAEQDVDCYLMERDYLGGFTRFADVGAPRAWRSRLDQLSSASECALKCASETQFQCLSFEFCPTEAAAAGAKPASSSSTCYLQEKHDPGVVVNMEAILRPAAADAPHSRTGCDHYSRSHLADFNRFEFRTLSAEQLERLVTSQAYGLSVSHCAEKCATELADCSAFVTCEHLPAGGGSQRLGRDCTFVHGFRGARPAGADEISAVVDEQLNEVRDGAANKSATSGRPVLEYNSNCQVFALRRDSLEAHLRDLALGGLVNAREFEQQAQQEAAQAAQSGGLSILGVLALYLSVALASTALGCALVYLRDTQNSLVRTRVDRLRIALGV